MNLLALLITLGSSIHYLNAQTTFGVHAGVTGTTFNYSEDAPVNWSTLLSYNFGVPIIFREKSPVSIQTGFDLVQRGGRFPASLGLGRGDDSKASQVYSYMEIPLLLRLGNSGEDATFHFIVGPSLNFGLSGKVIVGDSQDVIEFKDSRTKRFELGGRVGAQIGFPLGEGRLVFDGRYRPGLTKLNDDDSEIKLTSTGFDTRLIYLILLRS